MGGGKDKLHIDTLHDALENMVKTPERQPGKKMRTPLSGVYKIKGVGDVLTGRVEQGEVKPGDEVVFLPTHTASTPCTGKVFTVEMHHKAVEAAGPGDNVGMNIKGLNKANMPRVGDVMVEIGRHHWPRQIVHCPSANLAPPGRVETRLHSDRFRAHWSLGREIVGHRLEDWQRDWWRKKGNPAALESQRSRASRLRSATTVCCRHVQ